MSILAGAAHITRYRVGQIAQQMLIEHESKREEGVVSLMAAIFRKSTSMTAGY